MILNADGFVYIASPGGSDSQMWDLKSKDLNFQNCPKVITIRREFVICNWKAYDLNS
jgi:hypothetical protein